VKRLLVLAALLAAALGAPTAGSAATKAFAPCGPNGLLCATLSVPVDYPGGTLGQTSLYAEELPAAGTARGVMFLVAGGPGQASAETFELGPKASYWRQFFPGYTLVVYDNRGTGKSGPLTCPLARTVADCAAAIPNRSYYTTREHAEDIESIRLALGVDKVGVFGVSYGSKQAVAYALAHPDHVERLVLDSEVLPDRDPLGTESLRSVVGSIDGICSFNACPGLGGGIGERFAELTNRFQTTPLTATTHFAPTFGTFPETIGGLTMLSLAFESDLASAISSQLPAAIDAAAAGNPVPLERLIYLDAVSNTAEQGDINVPLFFATSCGDGPFPWQPSDTPEARQAAFDAAVAALPVGSFGPFDSWALATSSAAACIDWPSPAGGTPLGPGPLPNVPVLVLAGSRDIRTPVSGANAIAARFPQAHVVVVPGAGHSVLNHSDCAATAVRGWLNGAVPGATCTPFRLYVPALGKWRSSVAATPPTARVAGLRGRTLAAFVQTIHDAEGIWFLLRETQVTISGLAGGRVTVFPSGKLAFQGFSDVAGLAVTGTVTLKMDPYGLPVVPATTTSGTLTLSGRGSAHGTLSIAGNRAAGTLGGHAVVIGF
jgi:pimeloyl-ACP methyl ester carboxylesterase